MRAALGKVSVKLLSGEAEKCAKEGKLQKFNSVVEKTFKYV